MDLCRKGRQNIFDRIASLVSTFIPLDIMNSSVLFQSRRDLVKAGSLYYNMIQVMFCLLLSRWFSSDIHVSRCLPDIWCCKSWQGFKGKNISPIEITAMVPKGRSFSPCEQFFSIRAKCTFDRLSTILIKIDNFCDVLYAFLYTELHHIRVYSKRKSFAAWGSKISSVRIHSYLQLVEAKTFLTAASLASVSDP